MQIRVGTDVEENARFERLLEKPSFFQRIYTEQERGYIARHRLPARAAAGLWCAKEAAAKALGDGLLGLKPNELEVRHDQKGAPCIALHGDALKQYPHAQFSLSISHSDDFSIAVCAVTI